MKKSSHFCYGSWGREKLLHHQVLWELILITHLQQHLKLILTHPEAAAHVSCGLIFSWRHRLDRVKHIDRRPSYLLQIDFQENHYAKYLIEGLHLHTAVTVTRFQNDIIGCHVVFMHSSLRKRHSVRVCSAVRRSFSRQEPELEGRLCAQCIWSLVEFSALFPLF